VAKVLLVPTGASLTAITLRVNVCSLLELCAEAMVMPNVRLVPGALLTLFAKVTARNALLHCAGVALVEVNVMMPVTVS
jgi:hypothetical protein